MGGTKSNEWLAACHRDHRRLGRHRRGAGARFARKGHALAPVPTEFAARADLSKSMAPAILSLSAEHVPEAGYRGLMQGRRTVVAGLVNKLVILVIRIVPRRIVLALVDARQRRRRPAQTT